MIAYPPTADQLDSIYLRLAAAFRRQKARRAARANGAPPLPLGEGRGEGEPEPLTITTGGHGGSGRGPASVRGPYRRRTVRVASHD